MWRASGAVKHREWAGEVGIIAAMQRVVEAGAGLRLAIILAAVTIALAAALGWSLYAASVPATNADAGNGLSWPLAFALLVVALCAGIAGHALARLRGGEALRDARVQAQWLGQLLDVWQWQTDREHRLTRLQPPQGAPGSSWVEGMNGGQALWDRFETLDAEGGLRARLAAQAPIIDLKVRRVGGNGASGWCLRGVPRHDSAGRFAGYIGTARQVDAEMARRADQAALDALLRALPGAVWVGEPDDGGGWRVRRCNDAATRMLGGVEARALPWERVLEALPADLRGATASLAPGGHASAGGWTVCLDTIGGEGTNAEGRLLALVPRADDSGGAGSPSDHESFSYTVSHDLRAPLRVVEGFTRILMEDYGRVLDRIGNDHLERVLGAAARMNSMIDALLALAQLSSQPLARQPVNLSQLAGFVVDDLRRQQPERVVEVQIEPGLMAQGDPTLLRVVLENLLGNAWKYSAKMSRAVIAFESAQHGGRRVYVVRDNGAGFDMRFSDRLFGVFQRLHSASDFQGTGVGLASVRRIIRRHGGDIWAESEVGQGARFYFTLGG